MVYLFVGAGQAGSAIVDDVFEHASMRTLATPLVFNSTVRDLQNLSNIGRDAWYGIAEQDGLVPGDVSGFEERVTGGFGRDPERADTVMSDHRQEVLTELDARFGPEVTGEDEEVGEGERIPFAFIFLGLGGGTGCGIAPHLAEAIRDYTDNVARVIAFGVLPNTAGPVGEGDDEISAGRQAWNTMYGLDRLEDAVDGIVLVDNQRLAYEDAAEGRFSQYNEYIASSVVDLIAGSARDRIDPGSYEDIDVPVIDVQDILTSIAVDGGTEPMYASMGRSVTMTKTLPGYILPFVGNKSVDGGTLSRIAASKQTIANATPENCERAIGMVRSPPKYVRDDSYRINVSVVRRYLQSLASEVNLGMALTDRNLASFTTLLTYARSDLSRITEIEEQAEKYRSDEVIA